MKEKALFLFYFPVCLRVWAPNLYYHRILFRKIGLIGMFAPSPLYTSGHVISENWKMQAHSQTMQKMRAGNAKCIYHSQCKNYKRLPLQEKQMNEKGEQSANKVPHSRLKCQCFCSASEQLKCFSEF